MDIPDTRIFIAGLLVDCPYEPNPADCALHNIRKKPMKERTEWSKQLSNEQVKQIVNIHKQCLKEKEAQRKNARYGHTKPSKSEYKIRCSSNLSATIDYRRAQIVEVNGCRQLEAVDANRQRHILVDNLDARAEL